MSRAVMKFIAVVELHFPRPKMADENVEQAWVASMVRNLRGYADDVLAAAAQRIVDTRTSKDGRWFPLPSECKAACDHEARLKGLQAQEGRLLAAPAVDASEFSEDRHVLALDLCKGPLGKEAARDGWLSALHAFARAHMRLPKGPELDGCRLNAEKFRAEVDMCERGEAGAFSGPLARLGRSIMARGEELKAAVSGGKHPHVR